MRTGLVEIISDLQDNFSGVYIRFFYEFTLRLSDPQGEDKKRIKQLKDVVNFLTHADDGPPKNYATLCCCIYHISFRIGDISRSMAMEDIAAEVLLPKIKGATFLKGDHYGALEAEFGDDGLIFTLYDELFDKGFFAAITMKGEPHMFWA